MNVALHPGGLQTTRSETSIECFHVVLSVINYIVIWDPRSFIGSGFKDFEVQHKDQLCRLQSLLSENLVGQHIAQDLVVRAVRGHARSACSSGRSVDFVPIAYLAKKNLYLTLFGPGGGHIVPPLSRICVYQCKYAYERIEKT